jgi:predicted nucleotidyltransferase
MVATTADLDEIIKSFIDALQEKITVDAIVLYGSYARGTAYELSDIDLAVISSDFEGVPMHRRQEIIADLTFHRDAVAVPKSGTPFVPRRDRTDG